MRSSRRCSSSCSRRKRRRSTGGRTGNAEAYDLYLKARALCGRPERRRPPQKRGDRAACARKRRRSTPDMPAPGHSSPLPVRSFISGRRVPSMRCGRRERAIALDPSSPSLTASAPAISRSRAGSRMREAAVDEALRARSRIRGRPTVRRPSFSSATGNLAEAIPLFERSVRMMQDGSCLRLPAHRLLSSRSGRFRGMRRAAQMAVARSQKASSSAIPPTERLRLGRPRPSPRWASATAPGNGSARRSPSIPGIWRCATAWQRPSPSHLDDERAGARECSNHSPRRSRLSATPRAARTWTRAGRRSATARHFRHAEAGRAPAS